MKQTLAIMRKELRGYFGSAMALIFIGIFSAVTLFTFFWIDGFFARGVADVRALFQRMPLLLAFLLSALTMRLWSEEERSGTEEILLTLPVSRWSLVLGKFLAVMVLVLLALGLTLFLPLTVSILGNLDWGPVVGGYLAAIMLAAAYAAIGLYVSSRTDNQIVALMVSALICGLLYLIGSPTVTDFFGNTIGGILRALGTSSHFESVLRGVVDLRDLVYYIAMAGLFLTLNVYALDTKRWSLGERTRTYRHTANLAMVLIAANLILVNVWLYPVSGLRLDLTEQQQYSLSSVTKELLAELDEPLTIRGYFSERTHPLLSPLVPDITDMLAEYEIAAKGNVDLQIIDPADDPEAEAEASQTYGIQPVPFQVAGRYETSIINSYFHILIRYGDQSQVLTFGDLIEIDQTRDGSVDVRLQNLEYDLTSAIRKSVYGFQSMDAVLRSFGEPAKVTLFATPNTLPEWLMEGPTLVEQATAEIGDGTGLISYEMIDPSDPASPMSPQTLYDTYRIQPLQASLFSPDTYYFYVLVEAGDEQQMVYPQGDLSEVSVRGQIESSLKRCASGFLQVVGLWTPPDPSQSNPYAQSQSISSWNELNASLSEEYQVRSVDLSAGSVPSDVDVLFLVAPQNLSDTERYAIDQYLMRGGAVIAAAGNYAVTADQYTGGLALMPLSDGISDMLGEWGIDIGQSLVMDPQNEPFPVQVARNVGGFQVQEIQAMSYPFFADVRSDGMAEEHPIVGNLQAVTMNWASPVTVDETADSERTVDILLQSSEQAWTQTSTQIQPDYELYPNLGFAPGGDLGVKNLAVSVQGRFNSAFEETPEPAEGEAPIADQAHIPSSPPTARLIVFGSAEFVDDLVFSVSSQLSRDRYLNSLKIAQNAVAWSTEDLDLLDIRARGTFSRVLQPMTREQQSFWETLNYGLALVSLIALGYVWSAQHHREEPLELLPLGGSTLGDEQAKVEV